MHTLRALLLLSCTAVALGCGGDDSCTVEDNGDGTKTIACDGSPAVTVWDAMDGDAGIGGLEGEPGAPGRAAPVSQNADSSVIG